jgi:hypothetical protein
MKHLLSALAIALPSSASARASTTTVGAQVTGLTAAAPRRSGHSKRWLELLSSALLCVVSAPALASVATYTNENEWRAAVGTYALENFDGFTAGAQVSSLPSLGLSLDKLGAYDAYPAIYDNRCGADLKSGVNMLINFGYPCQFTPVGDLVFRPLPGSEILAMAYWNTGGGDRTRLEFFDANGAVMGSIIADGGLSFVGIVSTVAPSWMRINEYSGNTIFSIDDLQVAGQIAGRSSDVRAPQIAERISDVPEPQTLALMLAGLMLAARGRQGRRAASNAG